MNQVDVVHQGIVDFNRRLGRLRCKYTKILKTMYTRRGRARCHSTSCSCRGPRCTQRARCSRGLARRQLGLHRYNKCSLSANFSTRTDCSEFLDLYSICQERTGTHTEQCSPSGTAAVDSLCSTNFRFCQSQHLGRQRRAGLSRRRAGDRFFRQQAVCICCRQPLGGLGRCRYKRKSFPSPRRSRQRLSGRTSLRLGSLLSMQTGQPQHPIDVLRHRTHQNCC